MLPSGRDDGALHSPELVARLGEAFACARARWPEIDLDEDVLRRYAFARLGTEADGTDGEAISKHAVDLYLACACSQREPDALTVFDHGYLSAVDAPLRRLGLDAAGVDEVKQEMRIHLFVDQASGSAPGIAGFSGRGPLKAWLRVVAVRTARRKLKSAPPRPTPIEDDKEDSGMHALAFADPELSAMKEAYREQFRRAFAAATRGLADHDRALLAMHVNDGMNPGEIAKIYRVHRTTILRSIGRILETIRDRTRDELLIEFAVDAEQYRSILRLIQSRLDVSLKSHLE